MAGGPPSLCLRARQFAFLNAREPVYVPGERRGGGRKRKKKRRKKEKEEEEEGERRGRAGGRKRKKRRRKKKKEEEEEEGERRIHSPESRPLPSLFLFLSRLLFIYSISSFVYSHPLQPRRG
ncbi:hypothetical protein HZU67_02581 [Apis mellifera carnica]|nr:hypothetical protein HZU67_02581 [Apis mellifera carnica]